MEGLATWGSPLEAGNRPPWRTAKTAGSSSHLSAPATGQGLVPARVAREIVVRKKIVSGPWWQGFFVVCFCLAFSASCERIEWWVAVATGEGAEAFLGIQGYVWDTQSDMAYEAVDKRRLRPKCCVSQLPLDFPSSEGWRWVAGLGKVLTTD